MRISDWSSDVCSSDLLFITTSRVGRIAVAPTAEKRITHDASPHKHESPRHPGRNRKASPHAPPRRFRATIAHRHDHPSNAPPGGEHLDPTTLVSYGARRILSVDRKSTRLNSSH